MTAPKNVSSRTPSSWEPQDDVLLRHLKEVKRLGWKDIAQYFNNRTPNACQFRWRRLKSGSLKTVKSSEEDEELLDAAMAQAEAVVAANVAAAAAAAAVNSPVSQDGSSPEAALRAVTGANMPAAESKQKSVPTAQSMPVPMPIPTSKVAHSYNSMVSSPHGSVVLGDASSGSVTAAMGVFPGSGMGNAGTGVGILPSSVNGAVQSGSLSKSPFSGASPALQGKFLKPRSSSISQDVVPNTLPPNGSGEQDENVGFIPKVFIKSRRGSAVVMNSLNPPVQSNVTALSASNLNSTKSRKNSFSSRSRRSSFNVASDRHFIPMSSSSSSRRSSVVAMPPTSVLPQTHPRRESFTTASQGMSRSNSISQFRRGSMQAGFIDMPIKQNSQPPPSSTPAVGNFSSLTKPWSNDEDKLLLEKRQRYHLSIDELSILLPHRSEQEIQWRMESLHISSVDESTSIPNNNPGSSPLQDDQRSSYSPDTAIDEHDVLADDDDVDIDVEIVGRMDDSVPPNQIRDISPTFSQSSSNGSSSARERSPVFSPGAHTLREHSPSVSDGNIISSYYGNGRMPSSVPKHIRNANGSHEETPHLTPNSSQSPQPPHNTLPQPSSQPLPSLNAIFKHII